MVENIRSKVVIWHYYDSYFLLFSYFYYYYYFYSSIFILRFFSVHSYCYYFPYLKYYGNKTYYQSLVDTYIIISCIGNIFFYSYYYKSIIIGVTLLAIGFFRDSLVDALFFFVFGDGVFFAGDLFFVFFNLFFFAGDVFFFLGGDFVFFVGDFVFFVGDFDFFFGDTNHYCLSRSCCDECDVRVLLTTQILAPGQETILLLINLKQVLEMRTCVKNLFAQDLISNRLYPISDFSLSRRVTTWDSVLNHR
jgi:hypothetical protein